MAIPAGYIFGAAILKFVTEALFENFRIADDRLAGREYFFDHFTGPGHAFLLVLLPPHLVGAALADASGGTAHRRR